MPKPFRGHIGMIQRNAIQSWTRLAPRPDIFLCGEEEGTAQIAAELQIAQLRIIARNEFGTPLLNDVLGRAREATQTPLLCYLNCDIILLQAFADASATVHAHFRQFLGVTHRWEIDLARPLQFAHGRQLTLDQLPPGHSGHHTAIDAFVFHREMYRDVPDLAIGRAWFDQWLIKDALTRDTPVVDLSKVARAIHQKHDYDHIPGGQQGAYNGQEAQRNLQIYGGVPHAYSLLSATHQLLRGRKIEPVRYRSEKFHAKQWLWRNFIQRTAPLRKQIGLTSYRAENAGR
jgi:hypothetical protein